MKKPLKELIFSKVVDLHPAAYEKMNFFINIFRGSMYFSGILILGNTSLAVFIMRATIQRYPKKAVVEIVINSEENVCVACKFC